MGLSSSTQDQASFDRLEETQVKRLNSVPAYVKKEALKIAILGDKQAGKSTLTQLLACPNYSGTDQSTRAVREQLISTVTSNLKKRNNVAHELLGFDLKGNQYLDFDREEK